MMKRIWIWGLLFIVILGQLGVGFAFTPITDYQVIFKPFYDSTGALQVAIRQYYFNDIPFALVVNPNSLRTKVLPFHEIELKPVNEAVCRNTPYVRAITKYTSAPFPTTNDGLVGADGPTPAMFLTVDMCPSLRDFEKTMFETTMALPQSKKGPVPIAISVTGVWINNHYLELQWLRQQEAAGRLEITWINHSFSHPYDKDQPYTKTFLLTPELDVQQEILGQECLLLSQGMTPSPFFRFPGLISDQRLIELLRSMSLIPVGSNAWLALGQVPKPGSIILVHGNGNEPKGIELLLTYYHEHKSDLDSGKLYLLPLRDALDGVVGL